MTQFLTPSFAKNIKDATYFKNSQLTAPTKPYKRAKFR